MKRFLPILSILLLGIATLPGCTGNALKTENVTGKVTLDGVPLAGANVRFLPKVDGQGEAGYANTDENGDYILQTLLGNANAGTVAGEYVVIFSKKETPAVEAKEYGSTDYGGSTGSGGQPKETLPAMYTQTSTSPFGATVSVGENVHNFDLKSKP